MSTPGDTDRKQHRLNMLKKKMGKQQLKGDMSEEMRKKLHKHIEKTQRQINKEKSGPQKTIVKNVTEKMDTTTKQPVRTGFEKLKIDKEGLKKNRLRKISKLNRFGKMAKKGLKAIPGLGAVIGIGSAIASGDASAAIPVLSAADSTGSPHAKAVEDPSSPAFKARKNSPEYKARIAKIKKIQAERRKKKLAERK